MPATVEKFNQWMPEESNNKKHTEEEISNVHIRGSHPSPLHQAER